MGKKIIAIIFAVFLILPLWAKSAPFLRQYNSSFTVDLASTSFLSHSTGSTWKDGNPPENARNNGLYYKNQELGVVGMINTRYKDSSAENVIYNGINYGKWTASGDVTISIELLSGEWFYRLGGTEYKRPFGLDVFARGRLENTGGGNAADDDIAGYSLHLGNQAYSSGEVEGVFTKTVPSDIVRRYSYMWWDVCLVLDPVADTLQDLVTFGGTTYDLLPSDITYTVDLSITVSCTDGSSATFPIHLEGYYKSSNYVSPNSSTIQPTLTVNAVATDFRLDGENGLIADGKNDILNKIATYNFTTSAYSGKDKAASSNSDSNKVFLFLSSSSSGLNSEGEFALHHARDPYGIVVPQPVFEVVMESTNTETGTAGYTRELPHAKGGTSRSVTFTGESKVTATEIPSVAMEIWGEITEQRKGGYFTSWKDSGDIYVRLTGQMIDTDGEKKPLDPLALPQGQYTEDIYIHVVMNI